jgi:hypothetical protein
MTALENYNTLQFTRMLIGDSITEFFPKVELQISDKLGIFSEHVGFIEAEEFSIRYGDDTDSSQSLDVKTYWDDSQLAKPYGMDYISGDFILSFKSIREIQDYPKSKSDQNIMSGVVTSVVSSYGFKGTFIEPTGNMDYWYQPYISDFEWINIMVKKALSSSNSAEPFFTFIDLKDQFHFRTLSHMMTIPATQEIVFSSLPGDRDNPMSALSYEVLWTGVNKDLDQWNTKYYYYDRTGMIQSPVDNKKINEMPDRKGTGLLPIQSSKISNVTKHRLYGTRFDDSEKDNYKGWINSFYRDQQAMMILRVVLRGAHTDLISGATIKTKVGSARSKDSLSTEFSGTWVIAESKHFVDYDHIPFTELWLIRNKIEYDQKNIFKQNLL